MSTETPASELPLRGEKLLKTVVNLILADPKCWLQTSWHCGTQHCVGGWIQLKGGRPEKDMAVIGDVQELLEISKNDAHWLCARNRTLGQIHCFAENFSVNGYDRDGYDRDGYARDGYDRDGYARDGYDRNGYDRNGYDRDGYARDGYARDGYARDGTRLKPFEI
jgi:hypothetical protein